MMRSRIHTTLTPLILLLAVAGTPLVAQAPIADSAFVRQNYTKREVRIPMRDGARLFTIVYVPKDALAANRYPILLQRTPFSVAPYGTGAYLARWARIGF